jgi:hypothetical protein
MASQGNKPTVLRLNHLTLNSVILAKARIHRASVFCKKFRKIDLVWILAFASMTSVQDYPTQQSTLKILPKLVRLLRL